MSLQMIVIEMTQKFTTAWGHQAEQLVEEYLGKIGDKIGAQSGGVMRFTPSMGSMGFISSWPDPDPENGGSRGLNQYDWLLGHLQSGNGFYYSPGTWPAEAGNERDLFAQWGCPSVICTPILRNELNGFAFWGSEDTPTWGMRELGGLKQVGNIFGIALDKMG
ncbi:hypothetical protein HOF92_14140 [bacterium]|jgi:hypothetical protein|nr:hypothetical protein [bacterium]